MTDDLGPVRIAALFEPTDYPEHREQRWKVQRTVPAGALGNDPVLHHRNRSNEPAAKVISSFAVNGEQRYVLPDRCVWAPLLGRERGDLPVHRDWQQLLAILKRILRWSGQSELEALSDYLKASSARDLLESLRSELAFVGIPLSLGSSPQDAWRELKDIIGRALTEIDAKTLTPLGQ